MDASLPSLLSTLTGALSSTTSSLPEASTLSTPPDSLSLLDTKNALLLSYLHNLSFLILLKLRHQRSLQEPSPPPSPSDDFIQLNSQVVHSLVTLRTYLEKGVRPLEAKLRYQIDKVLRAAEVASSTANASAKAAAPPSPGSSSASSSDDDEDGSTAASPPAIDELTYRPNPSAFLRPSTTTKSSTTAATATSGPYRPPRITSTLPPTATASSSSSKPGRAQKSATLDEFLTTELSSAPMPEPSIGSNFTNHGRSAGLGKRDRESRAERRAYEEANFVRLPKEVKKKKGRGDEGAGYGGEDWRGLGEGADRVGRLVKGEKRTALGALERSRKREGSGYADGGLGKKRRG